MIKRELIRKALILNHDSQTYFSKTDRVDSQLEAVMEMMERDNEQYQELVDKVAAYIDYPASPGRKSAAVYLDMENALKELRPNPPTPNEIADRLKALAINWLGELADHHDAFGSMDTELRKIATDVRKLGE